MNRRNVRLHGCTLAVMPTLRCEWYTMFLCWTYILNLSELNTAFIMSA